MWLWVIIAGGVLFAVTWVSFALARRLGNEREEARSQSAETLEAEILTRSKGPFV